MYRKIKGTNIFTGYSFTGPEHVLVVSKEGIVESIIPEAEAGEDTEFFDGIICPGFVNAHCHIELSHLKNKIPQHKGLVNFVQEVMTQRKAGNEEKLIAMQEAAAELYESGTVAVGDICNTTDSLFLKKESRLHWINFTEVSGFVEAGAQKRFDEANEVLQIFDHQPSCPAGRLSTSQNSLVPHAPYSVSKKLFALIADAMINRTVSIHNQESPEEDRLYIDKEGDFLALYKNFGIDISGFAPTGISSMQSWLPYFKKARKIISVHNTFTQAEDILFAKEMMQTDQLYLCLCPNANLFIENKLPPIELLIQHNCNIILGTDSYAGNSQLNIFEEIKTIQNNFPHIPFETILQWATLTGARALSIENKFGSFEKGKEPGVVLINGMNAIRLL